MKRILLAAALLASPAAAADQFDLVCTGQRRWAVGGAAEPVTARYRVDIAASRWCRDACATAEPLASAGPDRLMLKTKADGDERYEESVARGAGPWLDTYQGPYPPGDFWRIEGRCEEAAFSGLPAR